MASAFAHLSCFYWLFQLQRIALQFHRCARDAAAQFDHVGSSTRANRGELHLRAQLVASAEAPAPTAPTARRLHALRCHSPSWLQPPRPAACHELLRAQQRRLQRVDLADHRRQRTHHFLLVFKRGHKALAGHAAQTASCASPRSAPWPRAPTDRFARRQGRSWVAHGVFHHAADGCRKRQFAVMASSAASRPQSAD